MEEEFFDDIADYQEDIKVSIEEMPNKKKKVYEVVFKDLDDYEVDLFITKNGMRMNISSYDKTINGVIVLDTKEVIYRLFNMFSGFNFSILKENRELAKDYYDYLVDNNPDIDKKGILRKFSHGITFNSITSIRDYMLRNELVKFLLSKVKVKVMELYEDYNSNIVYKIIPEDYEEYIAKNIDDFILMKKGLIEYVYTHKIIEGKDEYYIGKFKMIMKNNDKINEQMGFSVKYGKSSVKFIIPLDINKEDYDNQIKSIINLLYSNFQDYKDKVIELSYTFNITDRQRVFFVNTLNRMNYVLLYEYVKNLSYNKNMFNVEGNYYMLFSTIFPIISN